MTNDFWVKIKTCLSFQFFLRGERGIKSREYKNSFASIQAMQTVRAKLKK